tara:strand:+ start:176 stop:325 length:150 start_codon:yes stop_codon:yes gene_type:complete
MSCLPGQFLIIIWYILGVGTLGLFLNYRKDELLIGLILLNITKPVQVAG